MIIGLSPICKWKLSVKINLKETCCEGMNWTKLAEDMVQ
jgi:hypothetical protein